MGRRSEEGRERGKKECVKRRKEGGRGKWEGKERNSKEGEQGPRSGKEFVSYMSQKQI